MSPPDWLYLPHLGLGGGQHGGGVADQGGHAGGGCKPGECSTASASSSARVNLTGQDLETSAIRGRGFPPGCDARGSESSNAGSSTCTRIRGGDEEAPERATGMAWYFANIAATVAKRRAGSDDQAKSTAAERMAALRRRVASRARCPRAEDASDASATGDITGQQPLRSRSVGGGDGDAAARASSQGQAPGGGGEAPRCATAQTEAATVAAHHGVAEEREGRRQPPGTTPHWLARQALLDRLSARVSPPSE